jgi:predicted RNA-binding Zn-ribbon protein involved in translation (DUF1610 family)
MALRWWQVLQQVLSPSNPHFPGNAPPSVVILRCPKCQRKIGENYVICPDCGTAIPA